MDGGFGASGDRAGDGCGDDGVGGEQVDDRPGRSVRSRVGRGPQHVAPPFGQLRDLAASYLDDVAHPPTAKQARSHNTRDKSWDATTLARFLTHVCDDRLHAAWRVAGSTGARRGEILGLRWSDIDLDAGTVTFGRQTVTVVTGQLIRQ